jgi:hypothetical protein
VGADRTSEEDFGMSQEDVLRWLGANPGWHRTAEVKRAVGKESSSVRGSLAALAKHGEIKMRLLGNGPKAGLEWSI